MSLSEILNSIRENSIKKDVLRQEIQVIARRITRMSKQAIFLAHKDRVDEAESLLREAGNSLTKLAEISRDHPSLFYTGLVDSAFEEYAEAQVFLSLIKDGRFIGPGEIGVPEEAYVLGLADVIGELRRRSLDLIRRGDVEGAERCLNVMEMIYTEIMGCDELLILIPGLRRKCDTGRRVIEATRGDVTTEARRVALNNTMRDLMRILESRTGHERQ
ncbi:MAG: haloacid dehalogenase [Candidatus Bathyarchaeia archaeon]